MKKISNKILISIVVCVLISSLILGIVTILESYIMIKTEIKQNIQAISEINRNKIDNVIVNTETIAADLKSNILVMDNNKELRVDLNGYEELNKFIGGIVKRNDNLSGIHIIFNSDVLTGMHGIVYQNVLGKGYYKNVKTEEIKSYKLHNFTNIRKGMWSKPYIRYIDENLSQEVISFTEPIYIDNNLIGIVKLDINTNIFKNIVNNIKINDTGYVFLLNDKLDYIIHKGLKSSDNLMNINSGEYKDIADEIKKNDSGVLNCSFEGTKKILGYSRVSNGWIIVTSVPVSEALKGIKYLSFLNIIIIIIGILISSKVAAYISRKISQPLVYATEFAEELASGNLDRKLDIISDDETAVLSRSLNKAAKNIYHLVNELKNTQIELIKQINDLRKSEENVSILAYKNYITNLPNRNYLTKEFPSILSDLNKNNRIGALVYIDIDNFRLINDTLGHTAGDVFLKKISKHFKNLLNKKDILCHTGEDAFVFFLSSIKSEDEIESFAKKILELFKQPIGMGKNKKFYITSSIGIAVYPNHGTNLETLLRSADTALNKAKSAGKNRFEVFSNEMNSNMLKKIELENKLRQAVENNEFVVFYQPKIDTKTGKMMAMESLVRWNSPTLGFVSPNEFIPLAEETGLIIPIGEYVLRESCRQNKIWQEKGFKPLRVAVNLSAKQLQQKNLVKVVKNILEETQLDAKYLELEITESVLMNNFNSSIGILNEIKDIGINIYLDDFGTGYSSLNYLRQLPINSIKIDKSFVDGLTINEKDSFIASSLINLAHGIDLSVVAEGVENVEQFNLLKNYGCDEIQGYYFSKPLNSEDFEQLLNKID